MESVRRRAAVWILKRASNDRLISLNLTPICYEKEIVELAFFSKALRGCTQFDVNNFVSFVNNGRTRL